MAVNKAMKSIGLTVLAGLLVLLLLNSCTRGGGTVRHGNLSYNATEVFGASTPALALAEAAGRGDVKEIYRLIAGGADANAVGQHGITPLWWAAWTENYEGFSALLDKGADPNAQRADGYPIMYLVADMKDARLLEAALKHGADPNLRDSKSGYTPLFPAVMNGLKPQIDLLLAAKANVNAQLPVSGETLPMVAIGARADYQLVFTLFEMGADPALKDIHGNTVADTIAIRSVNASNNRDPWRAKVLEYLRIKGVAAKSSSKK
jgi:ankyrin repeat protein